MIKYLEQLEDTFIDEVKNLLKQHKWHFESSARIFHKSIYYIGNHHSYVISQTRESKYYMYKIDFEFFINGDRNFSNRVIFNDDEFQKFKSLFYKIEYEIHTRKNNFIRCF